VQRDREKREGTDGAPDEEITPAEFTRRLGDGDGEGAGPDAPEVVEPTQGRDDDGPGGPPQKDMGRR
jgi:hypothetical protein